MPWLLYLGLAHFNSFMNIAVGPYLHRETQSALGEFLATIIQPAREFKTKGDR